MNTHKTDPRQLAAMRRRFGQKTQAARVGSAIVEELRRKRSEESKDRVSDQTNVEGQAGAHNEG